MSRSRWISLAFVVLFMVVTSVVPAWKERAGMVSHKSSDGVYVGFVLLVMGLVCIWSANPAAPEQNAAPAEKPSDESRPASPGRRSVGWLLLVLSIVIAAADVFR